MNLAIYSLPRHVVDALETPEVKEALANLKSGCARAKHDAHTALVKAGVTDRQMRERVIRQAVRTRRWGGQ